MQTPKKTVRIRHVLFAAAIAAVLTMASSFFPRTVSAQYDDIMGCEQSCAVAAGGWPFAYAVDYPGLSPVGSADIAGLLLRIDMLRVGSLVATFGCWSLMALALVWGWSKRT